MVRCKKCWCPSDVIPNHNTGCPEHPESPTDAQEQWNRGYQFGFDDNIIKDSDLARYYNKSFAFGYRQGKSEIDSLVDDAAQSRCFG